MDPFVIEPAPKYVHPGAVLGRGAARALPQAGLRFEGRREAGRAGDNLACAVGGLSKSVFALASEPFAAVGLHP